MSQPTARTIWHPDPELWSANRAEHRFANGYELVVFDLPATDGYPAQIGWEMFGGIGYSTLMASGQAASIGEAKDNCEAALVQRWLVDIRRRLKPPVHIDDRRASPVICPHSES